VGRRLILDTNVLIAYERGTIDRSLTFDGAKTASIQTLPMHTAYSRRATRGTITAVATDAMPDTDLLPVA
jgi:hypothetical protein